MGQDNRLQGCLTIIKAEIMMRKLHEGPSKRHFATTKIIEKCWMLDIGGELCTKMCIITVDLVMHVKEQED